MPVACAATLRMFRNAARLRLRWLYPTSVRGGRAGWQHAGHGVLMTEGRARRARCMLASHVMM